jgi:putative PIN family toxin of toxin-antitoxin system
MPNDKLVVDVNLFLASLFFKSKIGDTICKNIRDDFFILLSCPEFLEELIRKINFFVQKLNLNDLEIVDFWLNFVKNKSEFINLQSYLHICRDPKDDYLINLAVDGLAKHLITRDKDILEINQDFIKKIAITPEDFMLILRTKASLLP